MFPDRMTRYKTELEGLQIKQETLWTKEENGEDVESELIEVSNKIRGVKRCSEELRVFLYHEEKELRFQD